MVALSLKQEKFCDLYLESGNGAQSYVGAGYKAKNPDVAANNASRLLKDEKVNAYITAERNRLRSLGQIKRDDLLAKSAEIAFSNLDDVVHIHEETGDLQLRPGASLNSLDSISSSSSSSSEGSSNSFSIKRSDRNKALDALAKLIGAYDIEQGDGSKDFGNSAARVLAALGRVRPKQ